MRRFGSQPKNLVPWAPRVHSISIGSAVFARLTLVTNRHTDRPRYTCNNRPRLNNTWQARLLPYLLACVRVIRAAVYTGRMCICSANLRRHVPRFISIAEASVAERRFNLAARHTTRRRSQNFLRRASAGSDVLTIRIVYTSVPTYIHGAPKKPDCFLDLITLWWLVLESTICQNFRNFIEKKDTELAFQWV